MNQQSKILPITAVLSSFFPCHFSFSDMTCLVLAARSARTSAATLAETLGVVVNEGPLILAAHEGHHFIKISQKKQRHVTKKKLKT